MSLLLFYGRKPPAKKAVLTDAHKLYIFKEADKACESDGYKESKSKVFAKYAEYHEVTAEGLKSAYRRYKENGFGFVGNKTKGRPCKWDEEAKTNLREFLNGSIKHENAEWTQKLREEAESTCERRGSPYCYANFGKHARLNLEKELVVCV